MYAALIRCYRGIHKVPRLTLQEDSRWSLFSLVSQGQIPHLSCMRFLLHLLASAGTFSTSIMSKKNNGAAAGKALTHS